MIFLNFTKTYELIAITVDTKALYHAQFWFFDNKLFIKQIEETVIF